MFGLHYPYLLRRVGLQRISFILVVNQLDAQNFCFRISLFHACTCFEHHVLIVRRSKLYYTASGIIKPIGGRPLHGTATYRCDDTRGCIIQFWPPDDGLFILVINQLDAQNLFYNTFISCLYMFRAPFAHRQEVKIVLYSNWYHQTYRWPSLARDGHL